MYYYTCKNCILICNEYLLYCWHVTLGEVIFFGGKKIYFTQRNKFTNKITYILIIQNLYTHTIEMYNVHAGS